MATPAEDEGEDNQEDQNNTNEKKKRILKRKLKKKESEGAKSVSSGKAGKEVNDKTNNEIDITPVQGCEPVEDTESPQKQEDEKEYIEQNGATNTKKDTPQAERPEIAVDEASNKLNPDDVSSNSGFPDFGVESDEDEKMPGYKARAENLLNLFEDKSYIENP